MADENEGEVQWLEKRLDEQDMLLSSLQAEIANLSQSAKQNSTESLSALTQTDEWKSLVAQITETQTAAAQISSQLATLSERSQSPTPVVVPVIPTPQTQPANDPESPVVPTNPKTAIRKIRVL